MNSDLYAILGVSKDATLAEVKAAYLRLSKALHPDVNPHGATLMQAVNEAYEVLSDPAKRAKYDRGEKLKPFPTRETKTENWANEGGTINIVSIAASVTPPTMRGELIPLVSELLSRVVKDPRAVSVKELAGFLSNSIRPNRRARKRA